MNNTNQKIKNLLNLLNEKKIDLKKIKYQMDLISSTKEIQSYDYLEDLLNPETRKDARIPVDKPIPSATFQLKTSIAIDINDNGCFLFKCNPFFLAQESLIGKSFDVRFSDGRVLVYYRFFVGERSLSSAVYCNNHLLDGFTPIADKSLKWYPLGLNQVIPNNVYDQYRLVSASVNVHYVGPLDAVKGIIGGAIMFEKDQTLAVNSYRAASANSVLPAFDPELPTSATDNYIKKSESIFDNYRHAFYHKENSALEGIRLLYFPVDKTYESFVKICDGSYVDINYPIYKTTAEKYSYWNFSVPGDYYKTGFNWYVYGQGLSLDNRSIRADFCFNFECLPNVKFLNYCSMDTLIYDFNKEEKRRIIEKMKKVAIQVYRGKK